MSHSSPQEIIQLTEALVNGEIGEEDFARLEDHLRESPQARALYLEHVSMDPMLRWMFEGQEEVAPQAAPASGPAGEGRDQGKVVAFPSWRRSLALPVAALLAGCAVVLGVLFFGQGGATDRDGARVAAWDAEPSLVQSGLVENRPVPVGRLVTLKNGRVDLVLASGAIAMLEAPAEFTITGRNSLNLAAGRGEFDVPRGADGMTVSTPEAVVTDLGTRFEVQSGDAETLVNVSEGRVTVKEARDSDPEPLELVAGESWSSRSGSSLLANVTVGDPDPAAPDRLPAVDSAYRDLVLSGNPVKHWAFDGVEGVVFGEASNITLVDGPRPPDYPIFDAGNTAGRFAGNSILRVPDHTDSDYDFRNGDEITLEAWVRPQQVGDDRNIYIIGKGRTDNLAFPSENQNYSLRLRGQKKQACVSFLFRSAPAPDDGWEGDFHRWTSTTGFKPSNGWHHVAVTYRFGDPGSVRGYVDGKPVPGEWDMGGSSERPPVVDNDELWIGSSKGGSNSNSFAGLVDEIALFRKALSPDEIVRRVERNHAKSGQ